MADFDSETAGDGVIDKLRGSPVGTNDPNVIGDAGPTDVPPGTDGDVDPSLVEDVAPRDGTDPEMDPPLLEGTDATAEP